VAMVTAAERQLRKSWMPTAFLATSSVMVLVIGWSMWNDTHPEWRSYQEQFAVVERNIMLQQKADLERKIEHPDYVGDYNKAKKDYLASKTTFDAASDKLDQTEADLEELDIQLTAPEGESAATTTDNSGNAGGKPQQANAADLSELDKEMNSPGASDSSTKAAAKTVPDKSQATSTKTSQADLDELDKEMNGSSAPKASPAPAAAKQTKTAAPNKSDLDELDKEMSGPGAPSAHTAQTSRPSGAATAKGEKPKQTNDKDLEELDKEFQNASAPKPTEATATSSAPTQATSPQVDFAEADFTIDQKGAAAQVEFARRNELDVERRYNREMIGLPSNADLKRKQAASQLDEAKEQLDLALDKADLEAKKLEVKTAAQIARWAQGVQQFNALKLTSSTSSDPKLKEFQLASKNLADHMADLQRDLRLVNQRLTRNSSNDEEIEQTYVERLGAVDRCETCHKAAEDTAFAAAPQPFRTHPGDFLKWHPVEKFGCSSCHGGFGAALSKVEAHGGLIGKGRPLLTGDQAQSSCGKCHGESKELPGDSVYLAGAQLFKQSGCLGCHKVESIENPRKAGPSLDRVDEKVGPSWLIAWLMNPQSHSLEARMPNFGLTQQQAIQVAAYLMTQHGAAQIPELPPVPTFPADKIATGDDLVHKLGCLGCHVIRGEGNAVGPELTNLGNKARPNWVYAWLLNPRAYLKDARMPNFGLTNDQAVAIGDYLLSQATPKPPVAAFSPSMLDLAAARSGSEIISQRGCAGCHDIKGFDKIAAPDLTHVGDKTADVLEFGNDKKVKRDLYDWMVAKLQDPTTFNTDKFAARMPKFGLDEQESGQIAVYLLSLNSTELPPEYIKDATQPDTPMIVGRRIFTEHNCAGCHTIAGVGGKIGPELTREGEKVQADWLFNFLERPVRIRWWQDARMPNFSLSAQDATSLTQYLMELSNQPEPYEYTPPDKMVYPLAPEGATYFKELKCESCHPLGGKQDVSGGDTKKLGPDLAMASKRLKPDWMLRFLHDPQAFSPGTQMPTFNRPDHTYQSIIDFLMKEHQP